MAQAQNVGCIAEMINDLFSEGVMIKCHPWSHFNHIAIRSHWALSVSQQAQDCWEVIPSPTVSTELRLADRKRS